MTNVKTVVSRSTSGCRMSSGAAAPCGKSFERRTNAHRNLLAKPLPLLVSSRRASNSCRVICPMMLMCAPVARAVRAPARRASGGGAGARGRRARGRRRAERSGRRGRAALCAPVRLRAGRCRGRDRHRMPHFLMCLHKAPGLGKQQAGETGAHAGDLHG